MMDVDETFPYLAWLLDVSASFSIVTRRFSDGLV